MHLGTCPWEGPRCHSHRRRPTVALASLTLSRCRPCARRPSAHQKRNHPRRHRRHPASLTIPEPEPSSAVAATTTAVAVAATAGAVAVSAVTATGSEKEAQSWKLLLPQKFNKQVFDGRRNDPRDVPRMAPLRQPEARAREAGRH